MTFVGFSNYIKRELPAAVVVFFVALPLSLGIAVATGTPPSIGILSAIVGGVIVGLFAGCPLQVSGPAAGLITIVAEIVHDFGLVTLGAIVFLAGIIQIIFASFKMGSFFRAVAPSVIQGMLSAIGFTIIVSQFHVVVGDQPYSDPLKNLVTIPGSLIEGLFHFEPTSYHYSAMIGVITILTIFLWNNMPREFKILPPALVGVILSMAISFFYKLPIKHLVMPDNVLDDTNILSLYNFFDSFSNDFVLTAFTVAFVATAETLLTATAVDKMHNGPRTDYDKEVFAQGLGNVTCGFFGLLPVSGVIVRSSANVNSGAKTRWSTVTHGILLLIFILLLPHVLERIPTSSLGAILVYTGFKLVNLKAIIKIYKFSKTELITYLITFCAILITNLLEGIIIGLLVSLFFLVYKINHIEFDRKHLDDGTINISLNGAANFVTLPKIAKYLEDIEIGKKIEIFFGNVQYIDHSCIDFLLDWELQYEAAGGEVSLDLHSLTDRFSQLANEAIIKA